jgi:hypothetical protein
VPGEIRRGVGHIGRVVIPRFHNARIAFAIIEIPAKKFPGKAGAFKLVQGCRLGLCPPIYSGWHFIPLVVSPYDMDVDLDLGDNLRLKR